MDSSADPTSRSTTDADRVSAKRVRCFMLITRGMRTPTEVVRHLHSRSVEVTTFTTPVELFADSALFHIVDQMDNRKDSSSKPKNLPLLIIIVEPSHCPDIHALTDALEKYFPKTTVWSFEQDRKPQLHCMMSGCSTSTEKEAPNHHHHTTAQTEPLSSQVDSEIVVGNDIEEDDESAPRVIRFEDAVAASKEWSLEKVSTPDSNENHDDLLASDEDDSFDPIFEPPNFSAVDEDDIDDVDDDNESVENGSHRDINESTTTAVADDSNPPGFVSEEELAMLLGDGDFLFTDSEEKSS